MAFVDITEELRTKVALMRALGVDELETTSGHVRRVRLGPPPSAQAAAELPEPVPPEAPPIVSDDAIRAAKVAKAERRLFGAGSR